MTKNSPPTTLLHSVPVTHGAAKRCPARMLRAGTGAKASPSWVESGVYRDFSGFRGLIKWKAMLFYGLFMAFCCWKRQPGKSSSMFIKKIRSSKKSEKRSVIRYRFLKSKARLKFMQSITSHHYWCISEPHGFLGWKTALPPMETSPARLLCEDQMACSEF